MPKTPGVLTANDLLRFLQLEGVERLAYLDHLRERGMEWKAAELEAALEVIGRIERIDPSTYKDSVLREGKTHSDERAVMEGAGGRRIPLERTR